jgi:hypothetical protein
MKIWESNEEQKPLAPRGTFHAIEDDEPDIVARTKMHHEFCAFYFMLTLKRFMPWSRRVPQRWPQPWEPRKRAQQRAHRRWAQPRRKSRGSTAN